MTCQNCPAIFRVKKSHYLKNHKRSCSKSCRNELYKKAFTGNLNPNFRNSGARSCVKCGSNYRSYSKTRKYCTYKCSIPEKVIPERRDVKPRTPRVCKGCLVKNPKKGRRYCKECSPVGKGAAKYSCKVCKKEINGYVSNKRAFCGNRCRFAYAIGSGNPNYIDGRKDLRIRVREATRVTPFKILERDNFTCKKCGQIGRKLEVDHIKPFSKIYMEFIEENKGKSDDEILMASKLYWPLNDIENLQTLCKLCNLKKGRSWHG